MAAPLCARRDPQHRARVRPARAARHAGAPGAARAPALRSGCRGARRPTAASRRRTPRRSCSCRTVPRPDRRAICRAMTADPPPHFDASDPCRAASCASPPTTSTRACAASGPRKRLEIHNLGLGIEALDADLVFLQEVRRMNRAEARHFADTRFGWPEGAAGRLPGARGLRGGLPHQRDHARTASTATRCCRAGRSATSATTTSPTTASSSAACCTCRCTGTGAHGARDRGALRPDPRQPRAPGAAARRLHRARACRAASR